MSAEAAARGGSAVPALGDRRRRQRPAVFALDARLEIAHHAVGGLELAFLREPARTFRQRAANPPDEQRAVRADHHDPAPAVDAERRARHERIGEKRDHRHGHEAVRLLAGERASANVLRREFTDVRPIVTNSTPMPIPATKRQKFSVAAVSWNAMTRFAAVYQSSE